MYNFAEQEMINRATQMGKEAVGQPFTIKLAESGRANQVTVSGTIVECGFGYFRTVGSKQAVIFKVVMECGANKVQRTFHVRRIP